MNDIDSVLPLAEACCREIGWSFNPESARQTLASVVATGFAAVAGNGKPEGLALVMLMPFYADYRKVNAVELAWHSDPTLPPYRRAKIMIELFEAMETWANSMDAPLMVSTRTKPTMDFLVRKGYEPREVFYGREGF